MKIVRSGLSAVLVALVLGLMPASGALAQRSNFVQEFAGSTILLANGDTLEGPLVLHRNEDVVRMTMPDNTINTLSAVAVQSFAVKGEQVDRRRDAYYYDDFYDARRGYYYGSPAFFNRPLPKRRERPDTSLVRVFRTYRWNRDNDYSDYKSPAFFEQLSSGPTVLLRREALVERPVYAAGPYGYGGGYGGYGPSRYAGSYSEIKDNFYLGTSTGNIIPLRNPKKDMLAAYPKLARQIEKYAKQNNLNFTIARELAFIVNYANSLTEEKQP